MKRVVEPEMLDQLPANDPRAMRSRRDLERINRVMRSATLLGNAMDDLMQSTRPSRVVEFGAGDAGLLLRIARRNARHWPCMRVDLLDLKPVVSEETVAAFAALGWPAKVIRADVFDGASEPAESRSDATLVIANLFMHHFSDDRLGHLLNSIAASAHAFVCLEPRRSSFALLGSHLVGLIGANDVTRHDSVASVRAGFRDQELSALWPASDAWHLSERPVGMFSHQFIAVRNPIAGDAVPA